MKPELNLIHYYHAEQLRELGFSEPVMYHYILGDGTHTPRPNYLDVLGKERVNVEQFFIDYNVDYYLSCPTLEQVASWLRKKGIDIIIKKGKTLYNGFIRCNNGVLPFDQTAIKHIVDEDFDPDDMNIEFNIYDFETYEEILTRAISIILNCMMGYGEEP